jgi:hypothetical protein
MASRRYPVHPDLELGAPGLSGPDSPQLQRRRCGTFIHYGVGALDDGIEPAPSLPSEHSPEFSGLAHKFVGLMPRRSGRPHRGRKRYQGRLGCAGQIAGRQDEAS